MLGVVRLIVLVVTCWHAASPLLAMIMTLPACCLIRRWCETLVDDASILGLVIRGCRLVKAFTMLLGFRGWVRVADRRCTTYVILLVGVCGMLGTGLGMLMLARLVSMG